MIDGARQRTLNLFFGGQQGDLIKATLCELNRIFSLQDEARICPMEMERENTKRLFMILNVDVFFILFFGRFTPFSNLPFMAGIFV